MVLFYADGKIILFYTKLFMQGFLFLARVAFICNLFFLICLLLRHTGFTIPHSLNEFVIIVGWILSVLINIVFTGCTIGLLVMKKKITTPAWLVIINNLWLLFQVFYFLFLPFG